MIFDIPSDRESDGLADTSVCSKNAVSKELGENRFKQLGEKVGEERLERSGNSRSAAKAYAMAMLEKSEAGFKENYALLKKLSEM